jgi:multiple sugar transport system permease protein
MSNSIISSLRKILKNEMRRKQLLFAYLIIIPLFLIFFVFQVWPVFKLFDLSLRNWARVLSDRPSFIGLTNYILLFKDPLFWQVFGNTIKFTLMRVPLGLAIGLLIALAINQTKRLRGFYVFAWFSPFMTSVVAMALVFTYFYNPTYGLFNTILMKIGLPTHSFLNSTEEALPSIMFVDLWKTVGFTVVIFLAGLQNIPQEYYDAASIDGAGVLQRFSKITIPLLSPTTYLLILMNIVTSMRVFTPVFMMTSIHGSVSGGGLGGPLNSTNVMTLYMYETAFQYSNFTYAATISVVLFLIVFVFTLIQFKFLQVNLEY